MKLKDPDLLRNACYINGGWHGSELKSIVVRNPATGESLGTVPNFGAEETRQAIEAAAGAMPAWARRTAKERSAILRRWHESPGA